MLALKDKMMILTKMITEQGEVAITINRITTGSNMAGEVRTKSLKERIIATMQAKEQQILEMIHTAK